MSLSGRAHVEVFALLQLSWIPWMGPYQDDELIMSISCSCSWSVMSNVDLKVFEKNDLCALVALKFLSAQFVNFDTIFQAVLKLIVSLCCSLNDMCSFELIKPMIWKSPPHPLPPSQNKSKWSKCPTNTLECACDFYYFSVATFELARTPSVSPLLHTAVHELKRRLRCSLHFPRRECLWAGNHRCPFKHFYFLVTAFAYLHNAWQNGIS